MEHWIFGYGSLMWRPGFDYVERMPALLRGRHRRHSIVSYESWGTEEKPGLVVALHPGGQCRGVAFRIVAAKWPATVDYLATRERAYHHAELPVCLADREVRALTFLFNPDHPRAEGSLDLLTSARMIAEGRGTVGTSMSYLVGMMRELQAMGTDPGRRLKQLHRLALTTPAAEPVDNFSEIT